ncbi:MAG: hypothetical protein ACI30J_09815 [Paludibacteraceae bacterium]
MKRLTISLLATLLTTALYARVFIPNDSTEQPRQVVTGGFKLNATLSGMLLHNVYAGSAGGTSRLVGYELPRPACGEGAGGGATQGGAVGSNIPTSREPHPLRISTNPSAPISAVPRVSGEIGGFIDFNCAPHFVVQVNLLLGAEHLLLRNGTTQDDLWIFGMNMPIYLLGRYEFGRRGAVQFGGGPFTTFVFRGLMYGDSSPEYTDPFRRIYSADELTGEEQMVLSDNYSGLGITVGYEFWFGLQINLGYQWAISDILNYPHTDSYALPQKGYLSIAYRF